MFTFAAALLCLINTPLLCTKIFVWISGIYGVGMLYRLRDSLVIGSYPNIQPMTVTVKWQAKQINPYNYCDAKRA